MSIPWELAAHDGTPILMLEPNVDGDRDNPLAMRGGEVAVPSGARIIDKDPAEPTARYEFEFLASRDEVAFLEAFFDARQGKAGGFWFPTWQWEFDVYGISGGSLWVNRTGYVETFYPLGAAYRQLVLLYGGLWSVARITAVTASVASGIDLLGVSRSVSSDPEMPTDAGVHTRRIPGYRPLWLRYGRFDQDELVAESETSDGWCRIALAMVELPEEVPT